MKREQIGSDTVFLFPASEGSVQMGVLPGVGDGVAATIHVTTENLGRFVIPLNRRHVGVIAAVANWLLGMNEQQVAALRAHLVRESQNPNEGETK